MDSPQCHLVFLAGPSAGKSQAFDSARITLGRATNCDFQFDQNRDLAVASHHAEILFDEGMYYVHDLGTRGGTFVNGQRISGHHPLRSEDYVQLGKNGPEIVFRLGPGGPDPQPLPPPAPETGEIEFISGADAGRLFPVLGNQANRIGRRADIEISLDPKGDMVISGHHCTIEYDEGSFILVDTSRNGTFLNGSPVQGSCYLRDGDVLTLGEGGPMARFRVHPPRRIYPNATGEFPRLSTEPEKEVVGKRTAAMRADEIAAEQNRATPAPGKLDIPPAPSPPAAPPPPVRPTAPAADAAAVSAPAAPRPANRKRFSGPLVGAILLGIVVLVGIVAMTIVALKGQKPAGSPAVATPAPVASYEKEIRDAKPVKVAKGNFSVSIPAGWTTREDGGMLSAESADRVVSVDYARDPALGESAVLALLNRGGSGASKGETRKAGALDLTWFHGTRGDRSVVAALHQPKGDMPALAVLEAPGPVIEKMSDETIGALLRDNLKLQQTGWKPTPVPTATPTGTPQPVVTATPAATPSPTPAPATPTPGTPVKVASAALGLTLEIPSGWTGQSNERRATLSVRKPGGMAVRIGRDPKRLAPKTVFGAMAGDGWKVENSVENTAVGETGRMCSVAIMSKGNEHLLLVLLDTPSGATVIVYATAPAPLDDADKGEVTNIVRQAAEQAR